MQKATNSIHVHVHVPAGASCNVKLEFQFNDLNPTNPVLLVKLTDIALPSSKMLSSGVCCYIAKRPI